MPTLGELLVRDRVLTPETLKDALAVKAERGGRIGTNLVELGYVEEDVLARALGEQHDIDYLFGEVAIPPDVLALVSAEVADEYDVVPYRLDGQRLTVLCIDPTDLQRFDQLQFKLGRPLDKVVVPEFRLFELLRRHYRAFRDERGLSLRPQRARNRPDPKKEKLLEAAELIDESEFQALYAQVIAGDGKPPEEALEELVVLEGEALAELPAEHPAAAAAASLPAFARPDDLYELERRDGDRRWHKRTVPEERRQTDRRGAAGPAAPPPSADVAVDLDAAIAHAKAASQPLPGAPAAAPPPAAEPPMVPTGRIELPAGLRALANAEGPLDRASAEKLLEAGGRDQIARAVIRFALGRFQRALVLAVQGDVACGWDGLGGKLDKATVKKIAFPLAQPSVFQLVWETKSHYLGQFKANPVVVYFLRATGGEVPKTFFLMPVLVGGKCVNLFYADNGHQKLASRDISDVLLMGQRAGRAYQRLIQEKRKK